MPSVKTLRKEYVELLDQKRKIYTEYKQIRADMKELHNVKANVEYLLGLSPGQEKEKKGRGLR